MITLKKQHRRYEMYRDSGVEWLGEIPENWETKRLKFVADVRSSGIDKKREDHEEEFRFVGTDVVYSHEEINDDFELENVTVSPSEISKFRLQEGDILLTKDSVVPTRIADTAIIAEPIGNVVCGYHLTLVRPKRQFIANRFLFHYLRSSVVNRFFLSEAKGTTIIGIGTGTTSGVHVVCPSFSDQSSITSYLDEKCVLIDSIIAKKQRQIELLKEQRAATINQAVTKGLPTEALAKAGLDEGVEMKESGVEWVGKMPKSWKIRTIRNCIQGTFVNGLFKKADQFGEGTKIVNVINLYKEDFTVDYEELERVNATDGEKRTFRTQAGDIFFVRSSLKEEGIGVAAYLDKEMEQTVFECHLIKITPDPAITNPRFLAYFLNAPLIRKRVIALSQTTTMTTIAQPKLKSLEIVCPPIEIQKKIVEHIDRESDYYFSAIEHIERSISLFTEYKTSLIAHAVTGRIKVA